MVFHKNTHPSVFQQHHYFTSHVQKDDFGVAVGFCVIMRLVDIFGQLRRITILVWDTPSANSGESMPCGGGDINLNVWVEKGDACSILHEAMLHQMFRRLPQID